MEKHFFRYQILRYIADLRRMEPENIGIIIQNADEVSCRFHTHLGGRRGFDHHNYRLWREFFETEIQGPPVPVFQPDRASVDFLEYLQERCSGNYSLTRPLDLVLDTDNIKVAERYLFDTLVLTPDDEEKSITQPVQRLRSELKQRNILTHRSFKHKELFKTNGFVEMVEYQYIRNHGEDLPVIIQPVQNFLDITRTINAMARAKNLVGNIHRANIRADVSVVVDEFPAPTANDSDTKKWAFDEIQKDKEELRQEANVVDSTAKTVRLAASIEKDLEQIEMTLPQSELAFRQE